MCFKPGQKFENYQSVVGVGQFHPAYRPYDQFSDSDMDFDTDFDTKNDQSEKSFDPALFDVTRIPVDDFANQITLDDFEIFKKITPEEVSTFPWSSPSEAQ